MEVQNLKVNSALTCVSLALGSVLYRQVIPRANGQVERFNQTIEANLRKFAAACPEGRWWEYI